MAAKKLEDRVIEFLEKGQDDLDKTFRSLNVEGWTTGIPDPQAFIPKLEALGFTVRDNKISL